MVIWNAYLLVDVATEAAQGSSAAALGAAVIGGFVAAVTIGSIAWYNSKRPPGWEDKDRPDFVPKVDKQKNPGVGSPDA